MYKLYPYVSNDLSIGLFSLSDDDIYHSVTGAATEAYEKFILPANIDYYLLNQDNISVLDICFGIGYNSKSFINFIYQKFLKNFSKNNFSCKKILSPYNYTLHTNNIINRQYNDMIYTDKVITADNKEFYSEKIYTNNFNTRITHDECMKTNEIFKNKKFRISIKAIEIDKTLSFLSPFINSQISKIPKNQYKNDKIIKYSNIENYSKNNKLINTRLNPILTRYPTTVNLFLLNSVISSCPDILSDNDIPEVLNNKLYNGYFSKELCRYFNCLKYLDSNLYSKHNLSSFLHNIYYKYISRRYKSGLKALNSLGIDFCLKNTDARLELKSDNSKYDIIFLDAFTPSKCPCLWTYDFFKLLYEHLNDNGIILTYSTAASVRNAFLSAGFFIGNTYNEFENKYIGTIAAKNNDLIKYKLSEFDLGLLKTKAGIFYRDENLTDLNEAIIKRHDFEVKNSELISASQYKKTNSA